MKKFLAALFAATIVIWFLVLTSGPKKILEADFLDVGQGDAILIKMPGNQTMLIDGGPNNKILEKLGRHLPSFQKRIDIILLTHPHADHVSGLVEVLKRYDVGAIVLNGADLKTDVYSEFLKVIKEKNIPVIIAESGEAVHFGKNLEFDIIWPEKNSENLVFNKNAEGFGAKGNDVNNTSIVGKLIFEDFSMLLTGDATLEVENKLSAYGSNLKSDILKVGHHGSKYSSSLLFLNTVLPEAAIIEVGAKNFYGHPSLAALGRLQMLDINVFRTDQNGDIKVLSNGFTTNIYKEK